MLADAVQHALKSCSSGLDKVLVETPNSLFLGRWGHNDSRVVAVEDFVEPEKITVAALNGEFGDFESF